MIENKADAKAPFPHCDDLVLHAPNHCQYCDMYPEKQQERIKSGTNFTGEHNPTKYSCPAELRRSEELINKWSGNRPREYEPLNDILMGGCRDAQ